MRENILIRKAREIERGSPFQPTRTIGLTNGAMGYIPHREAYTQGGYEASYQSARYEPENGHRWAAAAVRLLRAMKSGLPVDNTSCSRQDLIKWVGTGAPDWHLRPGRRTSPRRA